MIDAPLAYAFGVGMVATVNPCGFAMLPAYLSFFLGLEGAGDDARTNVLRALLIGATITAGFVAVFGVLGHRVHRLLGVGAVDDRIVAAVAHDRARRCSSSCSARSCCGAAR